MLSPANCRVEREGRLLRLTMARASKRNALDRHLCRALADAVESASPEDTGAILLAGEGPSFCAGMDLDDSLGPGADELAGLHERIFTAGIRSRVPIVAVVQGHAIAGGTGLVANAHVVVAAPDAKFGLTEIRIGLWPFLVFRAVEAAAGARRTLEWSLTGRVFGADEALASGLVHRLGGAAEAEEIAGELASRAPDAVRLGMQYFRESRWIAHADQGKLAARLRSELMASPEYAAAVEEFRRRKR
jgi:enoyl-CoA hydratase/carnithine racemase